MDILVQSTGDGGDYIFKGNDLSFGSEFWNQVFLSLFGGNVEESTKRTYKINEQRGDWWANSLLFSQNQTAQYNSETERALQNIALTPSGINALQKAIAKDLAYLKELGTLQLSIDLINSKRISILASIKEQPDSDFKFVWDAALNTIITDEVI